MGQSGEVCIKTEMWPKSDMYKQRMGEYCTKIHGGCKVAREKGKCIHRPDQARIYTQKLKTVKKGVQTTSWRPITIIQKKLEITEGFCMVMKI